MKGILIFYLDLLKLIDEFLERWERENNLMQRKRMRMVDVDRDRLICSRLVYWVK